MLRVTRGARATISVIAFVAVMLLLAFGVGAIMFVPHTRINLIVLVLLALLSVPLAVVMILTAPPLIVVRSWDEPMWLRMIAVFAFCAAIFEGSVAAVLLISSASLVTALPILLASGALILNVLLLALPTCSRSGKHTQHRNYRHPNTSARVGTVHSALSFVRHPTTPGKGRTIHPHATPAVRAPPSRADLRHPVHSPHRKRPPLARARTATSSTSQTRNRRSEPALVPRAAPQPTPRWTHTTTGKRNGARPQKAPYRTLSSVFSSGPNLLPFPAS